MERKEILAIALIGIMLLTVGLQTIQLAGLTQAQVITPAASGAAVAPVKAASSGGPSPSVSANLQNLPSMVGGC